MWYVEAGRGRKLPLTPEEGASSDAVKAAQASHAGSYSIRTEMRRSVYHRTFLAHSTLYRGAQRRKSTLPGHLHLSLHVPHFSYSEAGPSPLRPSPRPYRSTDDVLDTAEFPLRIKKDLSADTFRRSLDSESTSSYVSPHSHRSVSNPAEDLDPDVFSRQSSECSEELRGKKKAHRGRLLSFQDQCRKRLESDRCVSEGDNESAMKTAPTSFSEAEVHWQEKPALSKEESTENDATLSDGDRGEGYDFAMKQFESFDQLCRSELSQRDSDDLSDESRSTKGDIFKQGLFPWKKDYSEEYDSDNLATNREAIAFKFDVLSEQSDKDQDSPSDLSHQFNFRKGLFPGKRKPTTESVDGEMKEEHDEGFESPHAAQVDDDLFGSQVELRRREAFRKERSLDSDETSGFVSKHSSETTDLSSRLSSTQFTTKHLSEPMGFGAGSPATEMPQHLSEPNDFGSRKFLSVEQEPTPGTMSKKREHFRKSKRLRHFNLRRIDDTDNDSSCDSDKPPATVEEPPEPPSTRLKEEVGLPKHLSRDSSVDRYGLYKSRSEKTITSFESDRVGQARLHDFESFCEAVTFSRPAAAPMRQKAASADETELSDTEQLPRAVVRRKSRSKRDLSHRLKCLLL